MSMRIHVFPIPWALALGLIACGGAQRTDSGEPTPCVEPIPPPPTDYVGRMRSSLAEAGVDPDTLECNSRVLWGSTLFADSRSLAADMEALYEPHLRRRIRDQERRSARDGVARLAFNWMIRTVIINGGAHNLGGLAVPGRSWTDESGESHPLVLLHSATTGETEEAGSCFRSLIEQGRVGHVVNLYAGSVPLTDHIEAEERVARELGATYVDAGDGSLEYGNWRDVAGDEDPTPEAREEAMRQVARLIREQVLEPRGEPPRGNVYVHCAGGMHRSMTIGGVIRRCLAEQPIEAVEEAMQYHGAYQNEETPNGYEEPILRFVEAFDCSLLAETDAPSAATAEEAPAEPSDDVPAEGEGAPAAAE